MALVFGRHLGEAFRLGAVTDSVALDRIRAKLALLAELDAEDGFGVLLDTRQPELVSVPGIPAERIAAFGLYRQLGGAYLRFDSPLAVHTLLDWTSEAWIDPYDIGPSVGIGGFSPVEDVFLDLVRYRLDTGIVYFGDADQLGYYHTETDVPVVQFAPDATTFVDDCLLGQGYVDVLAQCGGLHIARKGRLRGQPGDNWLRLLIRAGLADPTLVRSAEELTVVVQRADWEAD